MSTLQERLEEYQARRIINSPGKLAAMLYFSHLAREQGIPLDPTTFRTKGGGQVRGLGPSRVHKILKSYGITRKLVREGGRTSRGNLGNLEDYAAFLEALQADGVADTAAIESWWVQRIKDFWAAQPFELKYDTSRSLRAIVKDLLAQAQKREVSNPGMKYAGIVLQHLVGAKLDLILPAGAVEHHGASVNDAASSRGGDFVIDEVVIHVTTAPGEALLAKCAANLENGYRPIIVTVPAGVGVAEYMAGTLKIDSRIDILDAEQFIATNIYELSRFKAASRRVTVKLLIDKYNEIIIDRESDPSLRVAMGE